MLIRRGVVVAIAIAVVPLSGCQERQRPAEATPAGRVVLSTTPALSHEAPPVTPTTSRSVPRRPRPVSGDQVERLARRWARAWTAAESGRATARDRSTLEALTSPEWLRQLRAHPLATRPDRARVVRVEVLKLSARRWMAVVQLLRSQSTEYLQLDIRRVGRGLRVRGLSD